MGGELATAGALVVLARNVVETLKTLGEVVRRTRQNEAQAEQFRRLIAQVNNYNSRLEELAMQLEQSERLNRMLPAWLEVANHLPFWGNLDDVSGSDLKRLYDELKNFIFDSIHDHFSATFFRTDYQKLPRVEDEIKIFREFLKDFDATLSAISPGDVAAFKALWGSLSTKFGSLRNKAWEIARLAEDLQGSLVRELLDSAKEASALAAWDYRSA